MISFLRLSKTILCLSTLLCTSLTDNINVGAMEWKETGIQLPESVSDMTATTVNDAIVIAGGCVSGNQFFDGDYPGYYCTEVTADTFLFDPEKKVFSSSGSLSGPRYRHAAVELDGKVYLVGGKDVNEIYVPSVEVYDPSLKKWSTFMILPEEYYAVDHAAVAYNGMIYVMGGYDADYIAYDRMYAINVKSKVIEAMPPMNEPRGDAHATVYTYEETGKKAIILAGGFTHVNGFCAALSTVEIYDFEQETWTKVSDMNEARGDNALVELNGVVYAIGGEAKHQDYCNPDVTVSESSASIAIDDVEALDPSLGVYSEWVIQDDLKDYRFRSASAVWRDSVGRSTVYLFGGQTAYNAVCNCFAASNRIYSFSVEDEKDSKGVNKVGIAVGVSFVCVAVVAIGALFWLKKGRAATREASPEKSYADGDVQAPNDYGIN